MDGRFGALRRASNWLVHYESTSCSPIVEVIDVPKSTGYTQRKPSRGSIELSIDREEVSQFFRVRLWDQNDFINQLLAHYDKRDDDLRAELPLKRIWTVAEVEETE